MYWLIVSGLFSKSSQELDLLPPPPPFPELEKAPEKEKKPEKKVPEKTKHSFEFKGFSKKEKATEKPVEKVEEIESIEVSEKKLGKIPERHEIEGKKKNPFMEILKHSGFVHDRDHKEELKQQQKEFDATRKIAKEKQAAGMIQEIRSQDELDSMLDDHLPKLVEKEHTKGGFLSAFKKKEVKDAAAQPDLEAGFVDPHLEHAQNEIQEAVSSIKNQTGFFGKPEHVEMPALVPKAEFKADEVHAIQDAIHKARMALMDFKLEEAKEIYLQIMHHYNQLDEQQKQRVYQDILDLYGERQSAARFKK